MEGLRTGQRSETNWAAPLGQRTELNRDIPTRPRAQMSLGLYGGSRTQSRSSAIAPRSPYIPPHGNRNRGAYNDDRPRPNVVSGGGMNNNRHSIEGPHSIVRPSGETDRQDNVHTNQYLRPSSGASRNSSNGFRNSTPSSVPHNNETRDNVRSQYDTTSGGMNTEGRRQANTHPRPSINGSRDTGSRNAFSNQMLRLIPRNTERQSDRTTLSSMTSRPGTNTQGQDCLVRGLRNLSSISGVRNGDGFPGPRPPSSTLQSTQGRDHVLGEPRNPSSNPGVGTGNGFQQPRPPSATLQNTQPLSGSRPRSRSRTSHSRVRDETFSRGRQNFSNRNVNPNPTPQQPEEDPGDIFEPAWVSLPGKEKTHFQMTRYGLLGERPRGGPYIWQMEREADRKRALARIRRIDAEPLRSLDLTGVPREFWRDIFQMDEPHYKGIDVNKIPEEYWSSLLQLYNDRYEERTERQKIPSHHLEAYIEATQKGKGKQEEETTFKGVVPSDIKEKIKRILLSRVRTVDFQPPGPGKKGKGRSDSGVALRSDAKL